LKQHRAFTLQIIFLVEELQ